MQRLRTVVVGVCGVALLLTSSARTGVAQQGTPEQQVMQLERDWCTAALKKDSAFLGHVLADDYAGVGSRGKKETKPEALADLSDKASTVTACVDTDVKVRVYGDAAVATGLGTRSGTYKGVAFKDRKFLWTDTFIRKDGRWQCVASQGTPIAAPQKD
jgi:ketosteroid isomerase-like protein